MRRVTSADVLGPRLRARMEAVPYAGPLAMDGLTLTKASRKDFLDREKASFDDKYSSLR